MPRTRATRKKQNNTQACKREKSILLEELKKRLESGCNDDLMAFEERSKEKKLCLPRKVANLTIGAFDKVNGFSTMGSTFAQQMLNRTRTLQQNSRILTVKRSNSFDEGYLTSGSSNSATTTGCRESRSKTRQAKSRRISQSSSPTAKLPVPPPTITTTNTSTSRKYQTPQNRVPLNNTYGIITPKVNPNTPQVLLRRPKHGEMVLSLQGSPLYASAVLTDEQANINIPLDDGKLLTLQPHRGLRLSQIPELNPRVQRQLQMLRDNLNKVCKMHEKR